MNTIIPFVVSWLLVAYNIYASVKLVNTRKSLTKYIDSVQSEYTRVCNENTALRNRINDLTSVEYRAVIYKSEYVDKTLKLIEPKRITADTILQ